jgi:tRNA-dihydrouridine synthase A
LIVYIGIRKLYIHARKCELKGLSPAQNRNVPPLNYDWVYSLVDLYPEMIFTLNGTTPVDYRVYTYSNVIIVTIGGVNSFESAEELLYGWESASDDGRKPRCVHGVMIGRAAYNNPWMFADADRRFFDTPNVGLTRRAVVEEYLTYVQQAQELQVYGSSTPNILKPLHNFFNCCKGNKFYKVKVMRFVHVMISKFKTIFIIL